MKFQTTSRVIAAFTMTAGLALAGSVVAAAPSQASGACVSYQYGNGGTGTCVRDIQTLLNYEYSGIARNYLTEDGQFGPNTNAAVRRLQTDRHLAQVDGIVGHDTWGALCNPEKGPAPDWYNAAAHNAGCAGY